MHLSTFRKSTHIWRISDSVSPVQFISNWAKTAKQVQNSVKLFPNYTNYKGIQAAHGWYTDQDARNNSLSVASEI